MYLSRSSGRRMRVVAIAGVCAVIGLFAVWRFAAYVPPLPRRPLRIGFENNPPIQIRTDSGFSGLSVETVTEAARRAGIRLQWVETGTSSEEAFRKGLVDLWPLMVDLPERRKLVHFARPWMHSSYVLLHRGDTLSPNRGFRGRIAVFKLPLHVHLLQELFPNAQIVQITPIPDLIKEVCTGQSAAAFFETRIAQSQLRESPEECSPAALRLQTIPDLRFQAGVASTFETAAAADRIQDEIGNMFRDGTLAYLIAKYSYFGLDDTYASYERTEEEQRWRFITLVACGLILATGVVLWLAGSLRERKRSEAALRESEERFRNLANTAPVMIAASGADGRASFFNKVWLEFTGRTVAQELGYGWLEGIHPDDRERTRAQYSASLAARRNCNIEYRLLRADGEYRQLMCNGVPRLDADGAFTGYIASCIDLTDIRNAQAEASERHNLEILGVLARGIAHDFNNLLGGTLAHAELAQTKLANRESPDDELRQICEGAIRGSEIVRQLMIFAGDERGALEEVDLSSLVRGMLKLLKVSISKHAGLKTDLAKGLPAVWGNAAQIRQVVMNLVTNASEAIGDRDGVIRVVTEHVVVSSGTAPEIRNLPEGDYVALEISDTGCGMTLETQNKVFAPFFSTKFAGRGMGLAIVHGIVHHLRGAVELASAVGQGTTVRVMLPCAVEQAQANVSPVAAGAPPRSAQAQMGGTVLIVEDEPALLAALPRMLQRRGYSVLEASDGTAALAMLRSPETRIDAMLLDVTLPGASSCEVFEGARRLRPELVVILTSAYGRESVVNSFAGLKVEHFIRKPFSIDDLSSLLGEALARATVSGT